MRLYESLTLADPLQNVDLIVVIAGRMERKQYGLDLFRAGLAPHLVISVGRFEVSKMKSLRLPGYGDLIEMRDRTPPEDRHFFAHIDSRGVRVHRAKLGRWNTYGEAVAFCDYIKEVHAQTVMVISTDIHLRRVALTFRIVCPDVPVQFLYCPVPPVQSSVKKEGWWTRSHDRRFVLKEITKLAGYRIIFSMPSRAAHWLMPLNSRK